MARIWPSEDAEVNVELGTDPDRGLQSVCKIDIGHDTIILPEKLAHRLCEDLWELLKGLPS